MAFPNFLIVGAPKAGTTTLFEILRSHPDIYLPDAKELHFFDNDENYQGGKNWYKKFFNKVRNETVIGEATPAYMFYEQVPERILETLGPDTKLIFCLRHPASRAFSEYLHNKRRGYIDEMSFSEAISYEEERRDLPTYEKRYHSFIERGYYHRYIRPFVEAFPKEQILFLLFEEDFLLNKEETIMKVQEFLGVEPAALSLDIHLNHATVPKSKKFYKLVNRKGKLRSFIKFLFPFADTRKKMRRKLNQMNRSKKKPRQLTEDEKKLLVNRYYRQDIEALQQTVGRSLSGWLRA